MRRLLATFLLATACVAATVALPQAASAAVPHLPKTTPFAGWEVPLGANHSQIGERFSSPAVGDLDGNGVMDVVAGFPNGHIYAWRTDNGALWFDHYTGAGAVQASPGLVDYDGDGRLDIAFANTHGDVGVVTSDRRTIFYAKIGNASNWYGAFATPAVADVDRDGRLDVVVSGFDQFLHAWGRDGRELPGFPVHLQDTSWSSPAVGDIDGDGVPEIVVGWDCDGAPGQNCGPNYGGYVGAFTGNGRLKPGWPRFVAKQVVWSTPALADIDGDGRKDVVVGTGNMDATMWDGGRQPMRGTQVFAYRGDGSNVAGWPVTVGRNVTSSPAVGDITGDGRPEVAFVAEDGYLYAYAGNGTRLWSRCAGNDPALRPNDGTVTYGQECPILRASPTIGDVIGDARQEVVVGGEQWMHVFDGATGNVVADGESAGGTDPMTATPTLVNVAGKAWIVEATTTQSGGFKGRVFAWTTGRALGNASWPTFKGTMDRSGTTAPEPLVVGGAIGDKWSSVGGQTGALGAPTTNEYAVTGGRAQQFRGGHVYWSQPTGARIVVGGILERYLAVGGPGGAVALPVADEGAAPGGRVSLFQRGRIYWSSTTGAWSVRGDILTRFLGLGGPGGWLGYPRSDEYAVPGGRGNSFSGGQVLWSLKTGAHPLRGGILLHHQQMGGTGGRLGFPLGAEYGVPGGNATDFERGSMYWSSGTGTWSAEGAIKERYLQLGGPGGRLGFPTSDEYAVPGGRANNFAGGRIIWSPGTGAQPVWGGILAHYDRFGGPGGVLGLPTSAETAVPGGVRSTFQRGHVYWGWQAGAREVRGAILSEYLRLGGPGGSLGLPRSDEFGVGADRQSDFFGGSLRWLAGSNTVIRV